MTLKQKMAAYAQQPQAENVLFFMAMAESCVAPAATESLLVPMTLVNIDKAFRYAFVATLGSVAGALLGYLLGSFLGRVLIEDVVINYGYIDYFYMVKAWFSGYAAMLVATAGFSPLPFKIFTVGSGILAADLPAFLMAALLARGARYWLICWLLWRGGPRFKEWVERNLAALTMSVALAVFLFFILVKYIWQYVA